MCSNCALLLSKINIICWFMKKIYKLALMFGLDIWCDNSSL